MISLLQIFRKRAMTSMITEHDVTVVVCTYNGEARIAACLESLLSQTKPVKVLVIDDGSTDATAEIVKSLGIEIVSLSNNMGIAEAREAALNVVQTSHIAFTDDDCIATTDWVENFVNSWNNAPAETSAIGGPVSVGNPNSFLEEFLQECNPLAPIEMHWSQNTGLIGRARYYLRANGEGQHQHRPVISMPTANLLCSRERAIQAGGFLSSNGVRGGEDERLCSRLRGTFGEETLWFDPQVKVLHWFEPTFRDFARRAYKQGRNSGQRWVSERGIPSLPPMASLVLLATLLAGLCLPSWSWLPVLLIPPLLHSSWVTSALRNRSLGRLGFPYVLLGQELVKLGSFFIGILKSLKAGRSKS